MHVIPIVFHRGLVRCYFQLIITKPAAKGLDVLHCMLSHLRKTGLTEDNLRAVQVIHIEAASERVPATGKPTVIHVS